MKTLHYLICSSLLTLTLFILAPVMSVRGSGSDDEKSIFILAGQSNMAGRGGVENGVWNHDTHYIELQPNPSILRLNANLEWVVAKDPLHDDIDTKKPWGVGPGMPFAHQILRRDSSLVPVPIGLVPCAIGSTNMTDWRRWGKLYNNTMRRASAALKDGGKIRALLWYQGEQEAMFGVGSFAKEVPTFFKAVREDLNLPELPIIQVALPPNVTGNFTKEIREIQKKMKLPLRRTVDGKGAELEPDGVHLNTQSQIKTGKKMADAFHKLIHKHN